MNKSKKIIKNQGLGAGRRTGGSDSVFSHKNKMLIIVGLVVMLGLVGIVCYINLRPRAILKVEGQDANGKAITSTVYYKEAMYDIYMAEGEQNKMGYIYEQLYGSSYWAQENVDGKGNNGSVATKKQIMSDLKQREILYLDAVKNGVSLSDDEKSKVEEDLKAFRDGLSGKQKKMFGLDEKTVRAVLEKKALADKYKEQIIAGLGIDENEVKAAVSQEDYRQYDLQYYTIGKSVTDAEGNSTKKSAADLKKAKQDMETLQKKAAKAADFTKDIITDSDNDGADDGTGISYTTNNLLGNDTNFASDAVRKKIKKMENGAVSKVLEDEDAYYVFKMVNNNDQEAYEQQCTSAVEEAKETQFNAKYKSDIKSAYTAKTQSYWTGRVTIGYITYVEEEEDEAGDGSDDASDGSASGAAADSASGTAAE